MTRTAIMYPDSASPIILHLVDITYELDRGVVLVGDVDSLDTDIFYGKQTITGSMVFNLRADAGCYHILKNFFNYEISGTPKTFGFNSNLVETFDLAIITGGAVDNSSSIKLNDVALKTLKIIINLKEFVRLEIGYIASSYSEYEYTSDISVQSVAPFSFNNAMVRVALGSGVGGFADYWLNGFNYTITKTFNDDTMYTAIDKDIQLLAMTGLETDISMKLLSSEYPYTTQSMLKASTNYPTSDVPDVYHLNVYFNYISPTSYDGMIQIRNAVISKATKDVATGKSDSSVELKSKSNMYSSGSGNFIKFKVV